MYPCVCLSSSPTTPPLAIHSLPSSLPPIKHSLSEYGLSTSQNMACAAESRSYVILCSACNDIYGKLGASDWLKTSVFSSNTNAKFWLECKLQIACVRCQNFVSLDFFKAFFSCKLITSNNMISLTQNHLLSRTQNHVITNISLSWTIYINLHHLTQSFFFYLPFIFWCLSTVDMIISKLH